MLNVLVVDDERPAMLELVDAVEEVMPDAEIRGFVKSLEALEHAQAHPVDVAFLDARMPRLDGLGLAKKLQELHLDIKIIMVTGYKEYALDAWNAFVNGFVVKPVTASDIRLQIEKLHIKPHDDPPRVRIQCFGNFGVFVAGEPLMFTRAKPKELFAYLVHRQGAPVTNREIAALLWEDKPYDTNLQTQTRNIRAQLIAMLREVGVEDIICKARNSVAIDTSKVSCDYYDYIGDKRLYAHTFTGEYLHEYSWAESTLGFLNNQAE